MTKVRRATLEVSGLPGERAPADRGPFAALTSALDAGVLLFGRSGDLLYATPAACRALGGDEPRALAQRWRTLLPELEAALSPDRARNASPNPARLELHLPAAEASEPGRKLHGELYRLDGDDGYGALLVLRDTGALESLEGDLRLASHLRGIAVLYQELVHDLKGPLNVMALNLELIRHALAGGADQEASAPAERREAYLRTLAGELAKLGSALEVLVHHAPAPVERWHRFDLREVIAEIEAALRERGRQRRVVVEAPSPEAPVYLSGDRQAITEALRKIAERALEATPEGGRLGMVLTSSSASARVRITDRGAGMTPDQLRRLARIPLAHPGDATAGSLHLARIAVELHGGTFRVTSRRGEGSQFEIELPLLAEEA